MTFWGQLYDEKELFLQKKAAKSVEAKNDTDRPAPAKKWQIRTQVPNKRLHLCA